MAGKVAAWMLGLILGSSLVNPLAYAADDVKGVTVTFTETEDSPSRTVSGRVVTNAQDGGILLLGEDGRFWAIGPEQIGQKKEADRPFAPLTPEALGQELQAEFGPRFGIHLTPHYVICSNANVNYAKWCGELFERLNRAFENYWTHRGVELKKPEFPLVAIVFANEEDFARFAARDAGPAAASAKGYFSPASNRMVLYDLTASSNVTQASTQEIERRLRAAPFNVATVIHEATHQIAFNTGIHTRFADNPLWLSEGLAMYFETPDLTSRTGWKTAGALNRMRLKRFQEYASLRRPPDSLEKLLAIDARFVDVDLAEDAYAEAWALSYFLIKTRTRDYVKYLEAISARKPLIFATPDERLDAFREVFGEDLSDLDEKFVRHMRRLRVR